MKSQLANLEMLLMDVDGVLTDASITYSDSGEQIKTFNSKDGLGLRLLMDSGIRTGIITGRRSKALEHRCKDLGITLLFDNIKDKANALDMIISQTGIASEKIGFAGDDLVDLPVIKRVGVSFSVPDAPEDVKNHCDFITTQKGGKGAVREICDNILKAKGLWQRIINTYLS